MIVTIVYSVSVKNRQDMIYTICNAFNVQVLYVTSYDDSPSVDVATVTAKESIQL